MMKVPSIFERHGKTTMAVFLGFSLLLVVIFFELSLRWVDGFVHTEPFFYENKKDGRAFGLVPNYRGNLTSPKGEYNVEIRTNNFGIRDDRRMDEILGTTGKKIMVMGDSFAFGYGVEYEEMFSTRLEKMLHKNNKSDVVFSTGFDNGWGTIQYEFYLKNI